MYLLDSNILSELIRRLPNPRVESRFESEPAPFFTSVICLEEMRYGASIAPPGNLLWARITAEVLPHVTVVPLDETTGLLAGDLRAQWKIAGTPVGYRDGLIGATALHHGWTLVTRNVRHFDHIAGLRIENWFEAPGAVV